MRRLAVLLLALALAWAPALAARRLVLHPSGPETTSATGTETSTRGAETLYINVYVTAGSGTVTSFEMFLESSMDGTIFTDVACLEFFKSGAGNPAKPTLNERTFIDETAVVTSAQYSAVCQPGGGTVRLNWTITGTSPSETFTAYAIVR